MSKLLQLATVMLAVIASLLFCTAALAQMPINPWKKAAPFPMPDEELYGTAVNGKMYVIGGWDEGKAAGINYEYDPATDKWTEKRYASVGPPCRRSHCQWQALRIRRLRASKGHSDTDRRRVGTRRRRMGVRSGGRFLEVAGSVTDETRGRGCG